MSTLAGLSNITTSSSTQHLQRLRHRFLPSTISMPIVISSTTLTLNNNLHQNHLFLSTTACPPNTIVCQASQTDLNAPVSSVSNDTWESLVLKAECPVLVEFWAPWCGPCRMLHPVVGELSKQYAGRIKCFQLNTDDHPSIATQYGIRSIPTVMIFVNGEKKDTIVGAVPKTTLTGSLDKFL